MVQKHGLRSVSLPLKSFLAPVFKGLSLCVLFFVSSLGPHAIAQSVAEPHQRVYSSDALQARIDAAVPGDVIDVPPGHYEGVLVLRDGVVVRGGGAGQTIIDGAGAPVVVTFGKDAVLMGFTLRNGEVLAENEGHFFGLLECTLEDYSRLALRMIGGSGLIANNRFTGTDSARAIFCYVANPLLLANLFEHNRVGLYASGALVPTLRYNRFYRNAEAIGIGQNTTLDLTDNEFIGNEVVAKGMDSDTWPAQVAADQVEPFVQQQGMDLDVYDDLLRATFASAIEAHPVLVYDLPAYPHIFASVAFYPWSTFAIGVSALDTRIVDYDAHDLVADRPLHAEYAEPDERPTVHVRNPELRERMRDRYVLESWYDHAPSYFDTPDGLRIFRRETNMARIEVHIPMGYQVVSMSPGAVLVTDDARTVVYIDEMGMTDVEVIMEPGLKE